MPESLNIPTMSADKRWRLIPSRGNPGSSTIEGTQRQAEEFGRALCELYGCKVLVTQIGDDGIPFNHHYVGRNPAKQTNTKEHNMSATTSMAKEPRTTNGTKGEVNTDVSASRVLTDEQKAQLAAKRSEKANGKPATRKSTPKAKTTTTPKEPKVHRTNKADLGRALTAVRKTLKELPDEQHATATGIRAELTQSWKAIENGLDGVDGYIATIQAARKLASEAKLVDTVKASDAAIKLAQGTKAQS